MSTILLTGARAPATLELARLFHGRGHRVLAADSVRHTLCAASRAVWRHYVVPPPRQRFAAFVAALIDLIERCHVDLLIPTCEEIFYVAGAHSDLSRRCRVFCLPLDRLDPLHNKLTFVQRAHGHGLSVPATVRMPAPIPFERYVLKPIYSRFASQTLVNPTRADVLRVGNNPNWIAQEFIAGQQLCTYSITHNGKVLAHTCYAAIHTAGQGAAVHFQHLDHSAALAWVEQFAARESFSGQVAFDFIDSEERGLVALECNPRATSGVHLLAQHPDFVNAFWNDEPAPRPIQPTGSRPAMLAAAMLLYGLGPALATRTVARWGAAFASARDVAFVLGDPLPALWQFLTLATFLYRGWRHRLSALEASTYDIEWNGGT